MHKCHNYYAILLKLYTWFGKNQLRLYLNGAKKFDWGAAAPRPPSKYAHVRTSRTFGPSLRPVRTGSVYRPLVQHHLRFRFGRETSNKFSVIKLQKSVFFHWIQQQSCLLTVECSFDFTNASLEEPVGQMEGWSGLSFYTRLAPGLWPVHGAGTNLKVGDKGGPLHLFGIKVQLVVLVSAFVMVCTVLPVSCLLFFCSRCHRVLWSRHHCLWLCYAWQ